MKYIFIILTLVLMSGCVAQPPLNKITSSGYPEAEYTNQSQDMISGKLLGYCAGRGFQIEKANDNLIVCSKEVSGTGGLLMQAMTNPYSVPRVNISFTLYTDRDIVKVFSRMWFETKNGYGSVNRTDATNTGDHNQVQAVLDGLGS
jgi:hypothetical protein